MGKIVWLALYMRRECSHWKQIDGHEKMPHNGIAYPCGSCNRCHEYVLFIEAQPVFEPAFKRDMLAAVLS